MLNSVRARIVFVVVMSVLIFFGWKFNISRHEGRLIAIVVISYLVLIMYGSYFIQSNFFIKALSHGSKDRKAIAITFDDGPMVDFTPRLLDLLKAENFPAAFFLIGKNFSWKEAL